jgi:hypothetical protein
VRAPGPHVRSGEPRQAGKAALCLQHGVELRLLRTTSDHGSGMQQKWCSCLCVLATRFRSELGHQGERAQCTGMAKITAEQLSIVKGCAVHTTCTGPRARAYLFS